MKRSDGKYKRTKLTVVRQQMTRVQFENGPKRPITLPKMPWDDKLETAEGGREA